MHTTPAVQIGFLGSSVAMLTYDPREPACPSRDEQHLGHSFLSWRACELTARLPAEAPLPPGWGAGAGCCARRRRPLWPWGFASEVVTKLSGTPALCTRQVPSQWRP